MQSVSPHPMSPEKAVSNVAVDILLTIATCGIYNLFWQARQFRVLNAFLGQERFRFWMWLLLTLVTCGIYHIYTEYLMGRSITEIQRQIGKPPAENLSLISLLLSIFGLTVVADAIQQSEINGFFEP
jgi:hypothetical protein